jgi:glycosyltransferase involved in cell wall biosynthesis
MEYDLTIGIPIFNEEKYIRDTIVSVQNQSYKNFNIYLFDDKSTDKSYSIAQEFVKNDKRISLFRNEENMGNLYTFLQILKISETPFFGWVGAHDLQEKNYVDLLINELKNNSAINYVYGDLCFIDEANNYLGKDEEKLVPTENEMTEIEKYMYMIGSCRNGGINFHGIYRKEILKNFWETQKNTYVGWDHIILSRANFFGAKHIPAARYNMRKFENRASTTFTRLISKESPLIGTKPTFIPLLMGYYRDYLSLPISFFEKFVGFFKITKNVPIQYEFSLFKNFLLHVLLLLKSKSLRRKV